MPNQPHYSTGDNARWREIVLLRRRLVSLKAQTRLLRHELARKYNPDQPRVPAGNADGGQWSSGGGGGPTLTGTDFLGDLGTALSAALSFGDVVPDTSGQESWAFYQDATRPDGSLAERAIVNRDGSTIHSEFAEPDRKSDWDERHTVTVPEGGKTTFETAGRTQTIRDGGPDGEIVSRSTWTERGPEREATVQQVFAQEGVRRAVSAAGTILFGWLSPSDDIDGHRTVMGFVPREYQPGKSGQMDLAFVGKPGEEEVEDACKKLESVQELANRAARAAGEPGNFSSMATYGTNVHVRFRDFVNDLNDLNFRAERSFLKEAADPTSSEELALGYSPLCAPTPMSTAPRMERFACMISRPAVADFRFVVPIYSQPRPF